MTSRLKDKRAVKVEIEGAEGNRHKYVRMVKEIAKSNVWRHDWEMDTWQQKS